MLNSFVISNNLFLIEDLARLIWSLYFLEFLVLILYLCEKFLRRTCLSIRSSCSVWSATFDFFGCWIMIFGFFMSFDNLVIVLGCSILYYLYCTMNVVTDLMSKMLAFSRFLSSWVITFDCVISFNCLEAVLGCIAVTDLMIQFMVLCEFLNIYFLKVVHNVL